MLFPCDLHRETGHDNSCWLCVRKKERKWKRKASTHNKNGTKNVNVHPTLKFGRLIEKHGIIK